MNSSSELLERIPTTLLPEEIISARIIEGGFNNRNILINESWLVKEYLIHNESIDPVYLRFLREKNSLWLLKQNPHAPQLLKYHDTDNHFLIVREWVEGKSFNINLDRDHVELLINAIISIHSITDSAAGDFHYYDVIKGYLQEYKKVFSHFTNFPHYQLVERFFHEHNHQIQSLGSGKPAVRIHGDLVLSNVILSYDKNDVVFIDWEYSTLGYPLFDLAYLLTQNQLSQKAQQTIIEKYEDQLEIQVNSNDLKLCCAIMNLMSGLWYVIQAANLKSMSIQLTEHQPSFTDLTTLALEKFHSLNLTDK